VARRLKLCDLNNIMNILCVNTSLGTRVGGGAAERTFQLSKYLASQPNTYCQVLVLNLDLEPSRTIDCESVEVISIAVLWKRFYLPIFWSRRICKAVVKADAIHLMGHWTILNAIVYILAKYHKKPYLFCPAGALPLFGRSLILKRIYNVLIGRSIVKDAAFRIAITKKEVSDYLGYGVNLSDIKVIPNGVVFDSCIDKAKSLSKAELLDRFYLSNTIKYILFMGRLNRIKGPDILLEAFAEISSELPNIHLIYCGPDGGMLNQLKKRSIELNIKNLVHYVGHVDGVIKALFYQYADLLVVPSRQEAMSIVALEAGIYKTPALVTRECGLPEIQTIHSLLEAPANAGCLGRNLLTLFARPGLLYQLGVSWNEYVVRNYTWSVVVKMYLNLLFSLKQTGK
jgi:glycosyltransferase involved in cell wall biosynthesis